jgi:predicted glycosyltransferase
MKNIFYFILTFLIVSVFYFEVKDQKENGSVENNFLKEVKIQDSTYVIVDYEFWNASYVLNNGITVSKSVIKTLLGDDYGK